MKQPRVVPATQVNPVTSWIRLPLRYVIAFCLIPVGLLFGVLGLCHEGMRKVVPTQRD